MFPHFLRQRHYLLSLLLVVLLSFLSVTVLKAQSSDATAVDESRVSHVSNGQAYHVFLPTLLNTDNHTASNLEVTENIENVTSKEEVSSAVELVSAAGGTPAATSILTSSQPFSLTWEVQVSFDASTSKKVVANWVMRQVNPGGTSSIVVNRPISKDCTIQPGVSITGEKANFSGGYIECRLPSFQVEATTYISSVLGSKPQENPCSCRFEQKRAPWVAVKFAPTRPKTPTIQPIAYLDSQLRYVFQANSPSTTGYTNLAFINSNGSFGNGSNSQQFSLASTLTTFTGYNPASITGTLNFGGHHEFLNSSSFKNVPASLSLNNFWSWVSGQGWVASPTQNYSIDPSPKILYIGGSPNTQDRFIGVMEKLSVDPACVGHS